MLEGVNLTKDYEAYLKNLPVIPDVAAKIMTVAEEKTDISFQELENMIIVDPGLTAKILKVANSALYARQREITNLQTAITLLGLKNIKSLVILITASNFIAKYNKTRFYQMFWKHSLITGLLAKHLAKRTGNGNKAEELFLTSLLHNIGQTAFYNADPEQYNRILSESETTGQPVTTLEEAAYGTNHKLLGAIVLRKWNFPDLYVDITRENRNININSPFKCLILIVTVASLITELLGFGFPAPDTATKLTEFMTLLNLNNDDLTYYKERFLEDNKQDPLFIECQNLFNLA